MNLKYKMCCFLVIKTEKTILNEYMNLWHTIDNHEKFCFTTAMFILCYTFINSGITSPQGLVNHQGVAFWDNIAVWTFPKVFWFWIWFGWTEDSGWHWAFIDWHLAYCYCHVFRGIWNESDGDVFEIYNELEMSKV